MVKIEDLDFISGKLRSMKRLFQLIKRIDSEGGLEISVEHPITRETIKIPIPENIRQTTINKLKTIKQEIVDRVQSVNWNIIE